MHLFGRKHDKRGEAEKATKASEGAEYDPLSLRLEEERRQRLEDVSKERAERLAAQKEQGRLNKENRRLAEEARELHLRLQEEQARAGRKGLMQALFGREQGGSSPD